jgi:RimJ/RimL family protein N-acetyltransferase
VIPAFQGRGAARTATAQVIDAARAEGARRSLHAYPSVDNAPSNGICRTLGFTLLGECSFEYPPGHPLVCNDWRLVLRPDGQRSARARPRPSAPTQWRPPGRAGR